MIVRRAGVALWIVAGSLALSAGGVGCNRTAEPTPDGTRRGGAAVTALATTSATAAQPASPPDPALERNPDAIDLSTWQRVADLPETCAVYVAPSPGETFRPLPLRPCGDRPGCTELLPSWGTEKGDAVTRLIDASSGYTHFSAFRGQQDAPRRALHVVETPDEKAVFAIRLGLERREGRARRRRLENHRPPRDRSPRACEPRPPAAAPLRHVTELL